MDIEYRLPVFRVLWKLLILAALPLLTWSYLSFTGISFDALDAGINVHKWAIFFLYIVLLVLWWWLNPRIERMLRRQK